MGEEVKVYRRLNCRICNCMEVEGVIRCLSRKRRRRMRKRRLWKRSSGVISGSVCRIASRCCGNRRTFRGFNWDYLVDSNAMRMQERVQPAGDEER